MRKLIKGILEFRQNYLQTYIDNFSHLALGQAPDTLFIVCSDSRVAPNLFASTNPGDLFVVRNVGNLIPPFSVSTNCLGTAEAAAIEFSLLNLPIANVIVCGHSECAAMKAVVAGIDQIEDIFLKSWLGNCDCPIDPEKSLLQFDPALAFHNKIAQMNILQQMNHLKSYPLVKKRLKEKTLNIHGWYFDIAKGDVYGFEEEFNRFLVIDEVEAARIFSRLPE